MSETLTASVYRFVAGVTALALAAIATVVWWQWDVPHLPTQTAVFALCFVVVGFLNVPIPRGRELTLLRFDEAIIVPMVLMLGAHDALIAAVGGTMLSQAIGRAQPVKVLFNSALVGLSVSASVAVVALLAGAAPGPSGRGIAAAVIGLLLGFLVTELLLAGLLSRAATPATSTVAIIRETLPIHAMMSSSNAAVGLLLVLPVFQAPWLLVGTLIPLLVLHNAYRAYVERAYEDEHLSNIRRYAHTLMESLRVEDAAMGLVHSARELVGADRVELRIRGHRFVYVASLREDGPVDADAIPTMPARRASDLVLQMRGRSDLEATLTVRSARLAVGESGFTPRERMLLDMLARQAQIGLDNALLFQRVTAEKTTLAQIFEHSTEGLMVVAEDGTVSSWNPAMESITGFRSDQMVGSPIALLASELRDIAGATEPGQIETQITAATGQRRYIAAYYSPIPPAEADMQRMAVVVVNDVTSRSEAERLKNDFVATVSHELRTPLTAIKGFVETMRRDDIVVSPARFPLFLEIMSEQTERLDRLISDLLDVSAIESGRPLRLDPEPLDVRDLVERTVEMFRAARPGVAIELECEPDVIALADRHRLQQVLTNLLDNAYKHAGPGEAIAVSSEAADGRALVRVIDRGPGIPEEEIEHIFDRFYFTSDSVTRHGGGAGLGLFICRQLVEAMDGRIGCMSEPGEGSQFLVELPLSTGLPLADSDDGDRDGDVDAARVPGAG